MSAKEKKTIPADQKNKIDSGKGFKLFLKIGTITIFVLVVISFIFLPAISRTQKGTTLPPFGKYAGKPIEYKQGTFFTNRVAYHGEEAKKNGTQIDNSTYFSLFNSAFRDTVFNLAFSDEVKKTGYIVPDNLVDKTMLPYFYDATGTYSPKVFRDTPDSTKISLRKEVSENLVYQRFVSDIFGDGGNSQFMTGQKPLFGLKQSSKEIPFITQMGLKDRSFDIASFSTQNYPATEIISFINQNKSLFASYKFSIITVDTEAAAKKLLKRLNTNEVLFDDAVAEYSNKTYSDNAGSFTSGYYFQLKNIVKTEESLNALIALPEGNVSSVVATGSVFSIFKCTGQPVEANSSLQTVQDAAYTYMTTYEAGIIEDYFTAQAKDFTLAAAKDGFDAACEQFNVTKVTTTPFPLNYNNNPLLGPMPYTTIPILSGAQNSDSFLKTAFSLKQGEFSKPVLVGKNVLVLQLVSETESTDASADTMNFMYPYYSSMFDQTSLETAIMGSSKVQNDVMSVYFKYFLKL